VALGFRQGEKLQTRGTIFLLIGLEVVEAMWQHDVEVRVSWFIGFNYPLHH